MGMDADDLFGLPLDRFIPERTALAKALRSEGRREEAADVAATRKPSVAAWAVNQMVRTQKRAVDELFEAGDDLRAAQDQVLAGHGDRQGLREAAERERHTVEELVKSARGLLNSEGHELSAAVIERVSDTLHAAALDEDARRQVQGGRLEHELRHVGFGVGAGGSAAPERRGRSTARRSSPAKPKTDTESIETRAQAREERRRAERERAAAVKSAREADGQARRAAQRAARALELAQERRDRAARALAAAEDDLDQARDEADAATAAHQAAGAELDQLTRGERGS